MTKRVLATVSLVGALIAPVAFAAIDSSIPSPVGLTSVGNVFTLIEKLLGWFIALFWIAAVAFVLYAAFLYVTAQGSEDKVKQANQMLLYAAIGIVVALLSTTLRPFLTSFLSGQ